MRGKAGISRCVSILTWAVLTAGYGEAATVSLVDQNSVAQFDTSSQAGQFSWLVDGVNQLAQQSFSFRIGPNGPEYPLGTLDPAPVINQLDEANFSSTYTGAQVQIKTTYGLLGGAPGSGTSDLTEQVRIKNLTGSSLEVHFFQYVDFDLNGVPGGDTVQFVNANSALQSKGPTSLAETVDTMNGAASTHREVNFFPNTLNSLNDGLPTTLNDNLGPIGPGNVTWAFQWDFNIPPGSTALISKDKNLVVPEPTSVGLLTLGCLLLVRRRFAA